MVGTSSMPTLNDSAEASASGCSSDTDPDTISALCQRHVSSSLGGSLGVRSCGTIHKLTDLGHLTGTGIYRKTSTIVSNRNNVAIATQVISPSAIGGSLHRRRLIRTFGPVDEDEEEDDGIFSRRRRMDWGKVACYGCSILVTLMLMTGVVLAVGYFQSEKQRFLTRSSKFVPTLLDSSLSLFESIPESRSLEPELIIPIIATESANGEYLESSAERLQVLVEREPTIGKQEDWSNSTRPNLDHNELKEDNGNVSSVEQAQPLEPMPDQNINSGSTMPESDRLNSVHSHSLPSEVKVLPPKDFNFGGFSFEIPIYNVSSRRADDTSRFTFSVKTKLNQADESGPNGNTESSNIVETVAMSSSTLPPGGAKLQTDLFVEESEEEADSRSDTPPKVTVPDRGYTPRPGSKVKYQEKPPKPYSNIRFIKNRPGFHRFSGNKPPVTFEPSPMDMTEEPQVPTTESPVTPTPPILTLDVGSDPPPDVPNNYEHVFSNKFDFNTQKSADLLRNFDFDSILKTSTDTTAQANFDFSQFTTPAAPSYDLSQFATSTQYLPDNSYASASQSPYATQNSFNFQMQTPSAGNSNPYSFLDSQTVASVMGLPSPIGANLNLNLDTSGSNHYFGDSAAIPSSVIPLDLARSYIQAGNPPPLAQPHPQANYDFGSAGFSQSNHNPNSGGGGNYNTITQGIHLLSLLSGNIPQHLMGQQVSVGDQFSSGNAPPFQYTFQPSTESYAGNQAFLSNFNLGALGSASIPSYTPYLPQGAYADLHQHKSLDQDQLGSFSQNILSKHSVQKEAAQEQAAELDVLGIQELLNKISGSGARPKSEVGMPLPSFLRSPVPAPDNSSRRPPVKKDSPFESAGVPDSVQSEIRTPVTGFGKKLIFKTKAMGLGKLGKVELKAGF